MLRQLAPWCSPSAAMSTRAASSNRSRRVWQTRCLLTQRSSLPAEWSQTLKNVYIKLVVPDAVKARDVAVDFDKAALSVKVQGDVVLDGSLEHGDGIDPDDCFWELEDIEGEGRILLLTMQKRNAAADLMGYDPWQRLFSSEVADTTITHRVFFEMQVGKKVFGKIVFGLYGNTVPRTVENFRALCTGEKGLGERGAPLTYKGSQILKIMPGFLIHGGDIVRNDGTGGDSIYGSPFPMQDENFVLNHNAPGKLGMANFGINSNLSQFNIVLQAVPFLDGKHVVFGEVIHGMQLLQLLERIPTVEGDRPELPVLISDCGELTEGEFRALVDTAGGAGKEAPLPPAPTTTLSKIDIGGADWPS